MCRDWASRHAAVKSMPESPEVRALIDEGFVRTVDIAPILGVTRQRVAQLAERDDFPRPAIVMGRRRLWRREDVERWRDAKPRVWAPAED